MGVRDHLEEALRQQRANGGAPTVIQFVLNNRPGRYCTNWQSQSEAAKAELALYRSEYVDEIAAIQSDHRYDSLRIVNLVEPDSLWMLAFTIQPGSCGAEARLDLFREGIRYALGKLAPAGNTYQYLDAARHSVLGWDTNVDRAADLAASVVAGSPSGFDGVAGVIVNAGGFDALTEPFLDVTKTINGQSIRSTRWVDWKSYVDELRFAQAFRNRLVSEGFPASTGVLIDTSRNGWGGPARPTAPSTSTDVNTFVDQSRVDRRLSTLNSCNQDGAGLGERPTAEPAPGIDAYVWAKPPGESDGSSSDVPNDEGRVFDRRCDPEYLDLSTSALPTATGALPDAPIRGAWFPTAFRQLLANAYPPLP
jgi:cellulose 1,4-beta-cellobiosidase